MKINWTNEQTQAMKRFYGQFVKAGSLVFNVGANVGTRTRVFLDLGADVIAVEPQHEMVLEILGMGLRLYVRDGRPSPLYWKTDSAEGPPTMVVGGVEVRGPRYERDSRGGSLLVLEAAVGPCIDMVDLHLCTDNQLATCAPGWAEALKDRWPMEKWQRTIPVKQITLDWLIAQVGAPQFIKIDVEGYEREVLRGLSARVPALCFEATIPYVEPAIECVEDLAGRLGFSEFNYLVQERMELVLEDWVSGEGMVEILCGLPESTFYCDVFAR